MPRNVSTTFVEAVNAANTEEVFLVLLTLDHPDLSEPIRLTGDSVKTTKTDGTEYVPFPFTVALPKEEDDLSGSLARIKTDAVDRRVIDAIRTISGVPSVDLEIVLASDPDTVEISWPTFALSNARYTKQSVDADLVLELLEQEPYPGGKIDPSNFPGAF